MRVVLQYSRVVDGANFWMQRFYLISEPGTTLFDERMWGLNIKGSIPMDAIRRRFGGEDQKSGRP